MSSCPVIQTYRLASLHEAAIARLKNPKNDRYKELYLQNREIGEKVYNAVLSGHLDLACFPSLSNSEALRLTSCLCPRLRSAVLDELAGYFAS